MTAKTPEYKAMRSAVSKSLWNDPEYRSRNLSKIPRGNCVSKISNECMSNLDDIFRLFGWGSGLFGGNEKVVFTGSKFNDIKNYRKLDYYHEQFNFVIEFQGDHWHPRDPATDRLDKIDESIVNDMSKFDSVKMALGTDSYFYVYEKLYNSNKDRVTHELVEDIFYSIES